MTTTPNPNGDTMSEQQVPPSNQTAQDIAGLAAGQLFLVGLQGVMDNQRLAANTLLAYQKDLFQGGQGESGLLFQSLQQPVAGTGSG